MNRGYVSIVSLCGFLCLWLISAPTGYADEGKMHVYVWSFNGESDEELDVATKFTRDFEEALIENGPVVVLERRAIANLMAQVANEQAVLRAAGMPAEAQELLKKREAEVVVFGNVYDDVDSGEVTVTVTFEKFNGEKVRMLRGSVPRGKINDAATRREVAAQMVAKLKAASRPAIKRKTRRDYVFEILEVRREDKRVIVEMEITSLDEDKNLKLYGRDNRPTNVWDNASVKRRASRVELAGYSSTSSVQSLLVDGVPAKAEVIFEDVNRNTTIFTRLDLSFYSQKEDGFSVTFRNLGIDNIDDQP